MKGIGATKGAGTTRGTVGATPTGIELGLDIKVGQLGISTDYGGGVVVGIAGQKIVWGREGGYIHYNVVGLEVFVEARNCVVTETRKAAGFVVSRYSYPDPGCVLPTPVPSPSSKKLPNIPPPQPETRHLPPPVNIDNVRGCTLKFRWTERHIEYNPYSSGCDTFLNIQLPPVGSQHRWGLLIGKTCEEEIRTVPGLWDMWTIFGTATFQREMSLIVTNDFSQRLLDDWMNYIYYVLMPTTFFAQTTDGELVEIGGGYPIGTGRIVEEPTIIATNCAKNPNVYTPLPDNSRSLPPLAGNQPPMQDKCCQATGADLQDIKDVLATKEILAGKLTFPWNVRMPGGQGEEVIMNYPNLVRAVAQMLDHLGIHPPKLTVKDINNAIAGDQGLSNQFPSATQGFEALMAQIWDANADVDTLTNFLYRLSWLCVQQTMNLAVLSGKVQTISDMLGGETVPSETTITTPFNISAGVKEKPTKGQGFGKEANKINAKIDANTELATESLLPDFLKIRENPIVIEQFSGDKDINDKIDIIIMKLESLQRG
jgi:hypothetical protein